jgi:hypothetical protein
VTNNRFSTYRILGFALMLTGLLVVAGGCDVLSKQDENREIAGDYEPIPGDSLPGFVAVFSPASRLDSPEVRSLIDLEEQQTAPPFRMTLRSGESTQPGDRENNDGTVEGRIVLPDSIFVTSDSTQLVYNDSLDYEFEGTYIFAVDRLYLRLDEDTTGPGRHQLIPTQWEVEDNGNVLRGSASRFVNRSGQTVSPPEDGDESGKPSMRLRLRLGRQ